MILAGLAFGGVLGGALGVGAGFAWVKLTQTTGFEGYSGMLVFFSFMPVGAIVGAALGTAIALSAH